MTTDPESPNSTNRSGGADLNAQGDLDVGGDVVGRDKIISAGDDIVMGDQVEAETYIEHATIVQDRTNRIWFGWAAVYDLPRMRLRSAQSMPSRRCMCCRREAPETSWHIAAFG